MAPTVRVCVDAARTAHVTTSLASVCASLATRGATVIEVGGIIRYVNTMEAFLCYIIVFL